MNNIYFKTELLYSQKKKSMLIAYLLWFFLGAFGAHYFYAKRNDFGILTLMLLLLGLTFGTPLMLFHVLLVLVGLVHTYVVVDKTNAKLKLQILSSLEEE